MLAPGSPIQISYFPSKIQYKPYNPPSYRRILPKCIKHHIFNSCKICNNVKIKLLSRWRRGNHPTEGLQQGHQARSPLTDCILKTITLWFKLLESNIPYIDFIGKFFIWCMIFFRVKFALPARPGTASNTLGGFFALFTYSFIFCNFRPSCLYQVD